MDRTEQGGHEPPRIVPPPLSGVVRVERLSGEETPAVEVVDLSDEEADSAPSTPPDGATSELTSETLRHELARSPRLRELLRDGST